MKDLLFDIGKPLPPHQRIPRECRCIPAGAMNGRGPVGETCGSCGHLEPLQFGDRQYVGKKCGLARAAWTTGASSDVKLTWPACEQWKEQVDGET